MPACRAVPEEEAGLWHRESECHRLFLDVLVPLFRTTSKLKPGWFWSWSDGSCIPRPKYSVTGSELRILFSWEKTWLLTGTIALPPHPIPALMLAL